MAEPTNAEIAAALDELGDLYELDGAVIHRVLAYRNAAKAIRDAPVSVLGLARESRATELPAVGAIIQEKVLALADTGAIPAAEKLRAKFPPGLVALTRLPGLGPRRARRLYEELGVDSLEALEQAAKTHRIRELRGFGPKAEDALLATAAAARERQAAGEAGGARITLSRALAAAEPLVAALRAHPACERVELAGSARRMTDSVKDIDIIATAHAPLELSRAAAELELVQSASTPAEAGVKLVTHTGVKVDLRIVAPDQFGNLLQHFTGSRDHNMALRAAAVRRGLHCHTDASDGTASIAEMARAAAAAGYEYLAITDHSTSVGARIEGAGLTAHIDRIRALSGTEEAGGITLLAGSEVNILPDGSLDYPDDVLAELDWVVASVHSSMNMDADRMTARIVAAIENPMVDVIGHLTGRKIEARAPYALDVPTVIQAAAATGTLLEINASPARRDLNEIHARAAAAAGVGIVIDCDAHRTGGFEVVRYGIATARRAWLGPEQVVNCRPWDELAARRPRVRAAA